MGMCWIFELRKKNKNKKINLYPTCEKGRVGSGQATGDKDQLVFSKDFYSVLFIYF